MGSEFFLSEWTRLRGANPAAQIFYVPYSEDVTLTRARGGWKPPFHGLRFETGLNLNVSGGEGVIAWIEVSGSRHELGR